MGLLNYLGGRGSSGFGEGSSRHYNAVIDARYKRYARRHRFRLRWFDYYLLARGSALQSRCLRVGSSPRRRRDVSLVAFHAGREALRCDRDLYDRDGPNGQSA